MNIQFGTGVLYGLPNAGDLAANPTPYQIGTLQEVSVDFKADLKKLFGQSQFPVAKARGKIDVTAKGKFATLDPTLLNQLYFGQAQTAGMTIMAVDEPATIGTGSPVVYTYTVANAAEFQTDYGVINATTGAQLVKVSAAPATGQYMVNPATGTYTFAAADAGNGVLISYTYSSVTRGATITLTNQLMGYAPEFRAFLFNSFRTKIFGLELYSCTMGSISVPTKQEDFWVSDIDFDAGVDTTGTLGKIYADLS
jgi:hypothetical protein